MIPETYANSSTVSNQVIYRGVWPNGDIEQSALSESCICVLILELKPMPGSVSVGGTVNLSWVFDPNLVQAFDIEVSADRVKLHGSIRWFHETDSFPWKVPEVLRQRFAGSRLVFRVRDYDKTVEHRSETTISNPLAYEGKPFKPYLYWHSQRNCSWNNRSTKLPE